MNKGNKNGNGSLGRILFFGSDERWERSEFDANSMVQSGLEWKAKQCVKCGIFSCSLCDIFFQN